jgi:hypothetical protein
VAAAGSRVAEAFSREGLYAFLSHLPLIFRKGIRSLSPLLIFLVSNFFLMHTGSIAWLIAPLSSEHSPGCPILQ